MEFCKALQIVDISPSKIGITAYFNNIQHFDFQCWKPTKSKDGKANVGNVHIQILIYLNGPDLDSSLMELT